ncbi:hypothetical protein MtrunA17_Chr8g0376941 [Medicago truncatula]|uniref:RALF-like protein n=1 Tax=Medicago truncatula TaxID=3880 RepID=A0A072TSQ2_MEDTR|nr:RALF-like protein [Medicago truncatula]RHN42443.1 hypothetical protein MtrunA17_Chr8g0376941 [Medicago truncatula]
MAKTIASLVLVFLVVAMLNGYGAEGAGRDNQHKKDDGVYKYQKNTLACVLMCKMCDFGYRPSCDEYDRFCTPYGLCIPQSPPTYNADVQTTPAQSGYSEVQNPNP